MTIDLRPELQRTEPDRHGGIDPSELAAWGIDPATIIDFSVNSNPYGPSPTVATALAGVTLDRYPDPEASALRGVLAAHHAVGAEQIVAGNGSIELIWLVALAVVRPGDRVLVVGPTFGEYRRVAGLMGGAVAEVRAAEEDSFAVPVVEVTRALAAEKCRLLFLCNPNNPTGVHLPLAQIGCWAAEHPHTLFVIDEAYLEFAQKQESSQALGRENVLVVRSLTKAYGLAGLRLGYGLGSPGMIDGLRRVRPPWSVNGFAQAGGVAALSDQSHLQRTLAATHESQGELVEQLRAAGLPPLPTAVNYFLLPVGDGAALRRWLLLRGLLVRECASFGLPGFVRIATRRPEENGQLIEALSDWKGEGQ